MAVLSAPRRGRAQERADHGEAEPRPHGRRSIWEVFESSCRLTNRVKRTMTTSIHQPTRRFDEHLLRVGGDHRATAIRRPPGSVIGARKRSSSSQSSASATAGEEGVHEREGKGGDR